LLNLFCSPQKKELKPCPKALDPSTRLASTLFAEYHLHWKEAYFNGEALAIAVLLRAAVADYV
jgi:hypothetical protein